MKLLTIFLLIALCFSIELIGQNLFDYEPEIIDGKAEALGQASILSSRGANYLFNNTAMLSNLNKTNIQINCRGITGTSNVYDTDKEHPFHFKLNAVSFCIPFNNNSSNKFALGAGYRVYYDWSNNLKFEERYLHYVNTFKKKTRGGLNTLVIGGAFNLSQKFYGGLSLSLPVFSNLSYEESEDGDLEYSSEGSVSGTFLTFSSAAILTRSLSAGFRLRTPFNLKEDWESTDITKSDNEIQIPIELGFALKFSANDNINFYIEYISRNLSNYYILKYDPEEYPYDPEIQTDGKSDNGFSLRTGFEAGNKSESFRFGLFLRSVPYYEYSKTDPSVIRKPKTETGITLGGGGKSKSTMTFDMYGSLSFLMYESDQFDTRSSETDDFSYFRLRVGLTLGFEI
ncbi:MAG: hypothetical protein K9M99_06195 [Candidatus Cloacimonetes bacterium]|nr:hypothetical protein [Candidatus Cloacimonadota bacterium]